MAINRGAAEEQHCQALRADHLSCE